MIPRSTFLKNGDLTMHKLLVFMMGALLAYGVIAEDSYNERLYSFRLVTMEQPEGLIDRCKEVIEDSGIGGIDMDGENSVAYVRALHRPAIDKNGLEKEKMRGKKKIGEMLLCLDWHSYVWGGIEYDNFVPAFFVVSIDGMTLYVSGGGLSDTFEGRLPGGGQFMTPYDPGSPDLVYPASGILVTNFSATILPSLPKAFTDAMGMEIEVAGYGGSMTLNYVYDMEDPDELSDDFRSDAVGVLRLFTPTED